MKTKWTLEDTNSLLATNDAGVWARAFIRIIDEEQPIIDEAYMIGWFTNAMEAQRLADQTRSND